VVNSRRTILSMKKTTVAISMFKKVKGIMKRKNEGG
jgi:hypothetical protein